MPLPHSAGTSTQLEHGTSGVLESGLQSRKDKAGNPESVSGGDRGELNSWENGCPEQKSGVRVPKADLEVRGQGRGVLRAPGGEKSGAWSAPL